MLVVLYIIYKGIIILPASTSIYQPLPTLASPFSNFPPLSGDVCSDPQQQPPLGAAPCGRLSENGGFLPNQRWKNPYLCRLINGKTYENHWEKRLNMAKKMENDD